MPPKTALPGGFCEDCFKGTLRGDVTPTGTEETIHGLPVYVTSPPPGVQPLGTVVIIPDIYGWGLRNTRALADVYARRTPCVVYLPDFMNGWAPPTEHLALADKIFSPPPGPTSWFTTLVRRPLWFVQFWALLLPRVFMIREAVARPRIFAFFRALRSAAPPASGPGSGSAPAPARGKVGVVGFCWGGRYAGLVAGAEEGLVDCGFTGHPSLVQIPGEVEAIRVPYSIAIGEDDMWLGAGDLARIQAILEAEDKGGVHEVVVYQGANHGFAVRGDPQDPKQAEFGLRAEDQAVAWFRKHLG